MKVRYARYLHFYVSALWFAGVFDIFLKDFYVPWWRGHNARFLIFMRTQTAWNLKRI